MNLHRAPIAARLAGLSGWKRHGMAVVLGVAAATALPPVHLLPALVVAFPGLLWLLDGARSRRGAFGTGWWFGLGHFSVGLYWIAHALLVEPEKFGWMIPFATLGLGGVLACFTGVATLLARQSGVEGAGRVPMLAATWTLMEWVRSWAFTGFPWNPVGSVWDPVLPILQIGAVAGIFGLSWFTVVVATLPALAGDALPRRVRLAALAKAVAFPLILYAWGSARLADAPSQVVDGVTLRLVQANIGQSHKWRDDLRLAHFQAHLELSQSPGLDAVTAVVWPETAAAFFLDLDERRRAEASTAAPPGGWLLAGAPRVAQEPFQVWNSLLAIGPDARLGGIYDKVHLVPFGEYVPLRGLLPQALNIGGADFTPGPGLRTMTLPGLPPFSPLVCYEAIFPGAVVGRDQPRPHWLLNITNDAWFGLSAGPYQHLASARMRAIEEGLPLVRVANTGISAVFDGLGRPVARLGLGERGVVDAPLPKALADPTPFGRWGNLVPLLLAAASAIIALVLGKVRRRTPHTT